MALATASQEVCKKLYSGCAGGRLCNAQRPDTPSSCETFTARRILWATPTAAGPSGDRSFGRLVKEVGQQTCRSADCTQCAQIDDRALAFQTRSSMRAAVEVIIHASRLVHEKENWVAIKVYFHVQLGDSYEAVFSLKFAYRESFTLRYCKHANVSELICQCESQLRSV